MGDLKFAHVFVHTGIESEYLKEFGEVDGYGLNIEVSWNFETFYEMDLRENDLNDTYDFGLFHPPCQKWGRGTRKKNLEENLIPRARELAEKHCKYWVLENVRNAPLEDSIILNGNMFNKELRYERQFETNFDIPEPKYVNKLDYEYDVSRVRKSKAGSIKGYTSGFYPVKSLKKNAVPRYYLQYILNYCPAFRDFEIENPIRKELI